MSIITFFENHPDAIIPIMSATISAAVAIVVLILNQIAAAKRSRAEFLTLKLEEVVDMINQLNEHNSERYSLLISLSEGKNKFDENNYNETSRVYGVIKYRKLSSLINLYFPKLKYAFEILEQTNIQLNEIILDFNDGHEVRDSKIEPALFYFEENLENMFREIIHNQITLTKSNWLPKIYKTIA